MKATIDSLIVGTSYDKTTISSLFESEDYEENGSWNITDHGIGVIGIHTKVIQGNRNGEDICLVFIWKNRNKPNHLELIYKF